VKKTPKTRFPDNVIAAALKQSDLPQPPVGDRRGEELHPKAVARAQGQAAARQWLLWIFGQAMTPALLGSSPINFGIDLSAPHRPTKIEFARALDRTIARFQTEFGFDRSNGYAQVNGKSLAINKAYGFWDELNEFGERFELWDLLSKHPEEEPETPPDLMVRKTDSTRDGGCNFCPARGIVYEVGSTIRTVKVRMCPHCVKSFRAQTQHVR
jgi:hypothetical protein